MSPHHTDQMSQWLQVSRIALCMAKVNVSDGSWRLSVGSWRSSAVPGGYLVLGVLLSCSGQLKITNDNKFQMPNVNW